MATYQFSALSDGQAISFNPTADILNFDQSAIAAADLRVTVSGSSTRIEVVAGPQAGKDILLLNTAQFQLATSNVIFVDGSRLLFGDDSTATGDDNGNTLTGGTGRDLIFAFGGSDTINVGTATYGDDFVDGGSGYDTLNFNGYITSGLEVDFATGTATGKGGTVTFANIERFAGGSGNDIINGNAANQNIGAVAGDDTIWGAGGNDTLFSGTGTDTFVFREAGATNADLVGDFASGTDKILLDAGVMTALGASGNFAAGDARFWAAAGAAGGHDADDRVVYNTTTRQLFYDADGNGSGAAQLMATLQSGATLVATDIVVQGGASGGQVINGTSGNDSIDGTEGDDTINGLAGDDTLNGMLGADRLDGGAGNDSLMGGDQSADHLIGGDGDDILLGRPLGFMIPSQAGEPDVLEGGLGNDSYYVTRADVILADPGGIDTVHAYNAHWVLGTGLDNLILHDTIGSGSISFGNELDNTIDGSGWEGLELHGMAGNDVLIGSHRGAGDFYGGEGNDTILGASRQDRLFGDAGNDVLNGGGVFDELTGGAGADAFVFASDPREWPSVVTDFASGVDKLRFDAEVFAQLGRSGDFASNDSRFYAAAGATGGHDIDDRIVFNTTTGQVFYDADGSGSGAAQLVVTLQSGAVLAASDIAVDNGIENQTINGGPGDDVLIGADGNDTINGLGGYDGIFGRGGDDSLSGGPGNDHLEGEEGTDYVSGGDGNDYLAGSSETDWWPNPYADTLDGGLGNDFYYVRSTDEVLIDAAGVDTVETTVDWALGAGFENLILKNAGLVIHGNELANRFTNYPHWTDDESDPPASTIFAGAGDDTFVESWVGSSTVFHGEAGDDVMYQTAGSKNNTFVGGSGADTFVLLAPGWTNYVNKMLDFASGVDKIRLDATEAPELGASGNFAAGDARFYAAAGATGGHDADDRVVHNTSTGEVFFDADGNGPESARLVVTLQIGATLAATDIAVDNGGPPNPPTGTVYHGTEGNDSIVGSAGNDTIFGHGGEDTLSGAAGDDWIDSGSGGPNTSWLRGDAGNDTLVGGINREFLDGGPGNDQLFAGDGDDQLQGGADDDFLSGGAGRDTFTISEFETPGIRSYGNDTIDGGPGDLDEIFVQQTSPLSVDLGAGTLNGGVPGSASVSNIEYFFVWFEDVFNDRLVGNSSNNYLFAGAGNDVVDGAAGNDWIDGGFGNDTVTGGAGADNFRYKEAPGAANADRITDFASGIDTIFLDGHMHRGIGGWGRFAFGDERFYSAPGANSGHDSTDRVVYDTSTGNLWFDGDGSGAGAAQLIASLQPGAALAATDIMVENPIVPWFFQGGPENNHATGDELDDTINGGGGDDTLRGLAGDDSLNGEDGDDSLLGAEGLDTLLGGAGNDTLDGGDGIDRLDGGLGNDTYVVTAGDVIVADPGGTDTVMTASSWNISSAAIENITMTGTSNVSVEGNNLANTIIGNDAPNYINARAGSDTLIGNGGNDTFNMSRGGTSSFGNDSIDGGAGVDTVEFGINALTGLVADLAAGTVTGGEAGGAGSSIILNIERFIAGDFNDVVTGSGVANYVDARAGNDTVNGAAGNDTLLGGTGNDRLAGGAGIDSMTGGAGLDSFVFGETPGSANADRITDFVSASDKILLDDAFHANIGAAGNFIAGDGRFWAAAGATSGHDANDRVIYNTSTGSLYYDADGSGAGAAQLIATFTGNPAIAATDIGVI